MKYTHNKKYKSISSKLYLPKDFTKNHWELHMEPQTEHQIWVAALNFKSSYDK